MRFLRFANAPVEMTYKEKSSFSKKTLEVNILQNLFSIYNKKSNILQCFYLLLSKKVITLLSYSNNSRH